MRLSIVLDVDQYPTLDDYRRFLAQLPDGARVVEVEEEETTINIMAELARDAS